MLGILSDSCNHNSFMIKCLQPEAKPISFWSHMLFYALFLPRILLFAERRNKVGDLPKLVWFFNSFTERSCLNGAHSDDHLHPELPGSTCISIKFCKAIKVQKIIILKIKTYGHLWDLRSFHAIYCNLKTINDGPTGVIHSLSGTWTFDIWHYNEDFVGIS